MNHATPFPQCLWRIWHFWYACWRKDWNAGQWGCTPPPVGGLTKKNEMKCTNWAYTHKKLTWKISLWKEKSIFQTFIFGFHVSLRGYKPNCGRIPLLNYPFFEAVFFGWLRKQPTETNLILAPRVNSRHYQFGTHGHVGIMFHVPSSNSSMFWNCFMVPQFLSSSIFHAFARNIPGVPPWSCHKTLHPSSHLHQVTVLVSNCKLRKSNISHTLRCETPASNSGRVEILIW